MMARPEPLSEPAPTNDPVSLALANAPLDDEPETAEERAAVAEAHADVAAGRLIDDADLDAQLGW